jgi:hypothetical protein
VVIGTDGTGSCKSNYHAIMNLMAPYIDAHFENEKLWKWKSSLYSKTCLNWSSARLTFLFWIDRCSVYTCWINQYFLHCHWDLRFGLQDSGLFKVRFKVRFTGFRFIQGSVYTGFTVAKKTKHKITKAC